MEINEINTSSQDQKNENKLNELINFQHAYRSSLACHMVDRSKFSLWSILKQCVDKELYRFTLPIIWNEPLSLLQRMAENIRFADELLEKASSLKNPCDRIKYLAGFLISSTSIHIHRLRLESISY